ncbi:hypothetical protein C0J52_23875 [Blattella germanica]|nr:hypothetical protein C0J52_23875 [Blattella germanica]
MVLENIVPFLQHETARNHALTPKQQLQIALHWLGTGAQFHAIADMHGVSKSSVCRAIQNVVHGINNNLFHVLVQWPNNVYEIIQKFSDRSGMPLVCGAIDGTLIKIDAPSAHEPAFVDRNGKHSLNVMLVCGPDCTFYFCNANWPGSVNDARVLRRSSLYTRMEQGWRPAPDAVLIGDSIYPLRSWLIPPLLRNPEDPAQLRFVRAHKKTRWIIESAIGILKEKFPCLNYLRVKPAYACNIIKACVTLCNLTKHEAVNYDDEDFRDDGNEMREEVEDNDAGNQKLQFFYNHFNSKYFFCHIL